MVYLTKMIVLDLDGTILDNNGKISKATKEYLNLLKSKGYIITVATGRIHTSALNATEGLSFANYVISSQGSYIYDMINKKVVSKNSINNKIVKKILENYADNSHYTQIYSEKIIYKYTDDSITDCSYRKITKDKGYILDVCKDVFLISIVMKNNAEVMKVYEELSKDSEQLDVILMQNSFSNKKWIDVIPRGCSKYNAIKELNSYSLINEQDIIAFGDGLNDIEMLKKCGKGIALKNALYEVKEVADEITRYDNNHDGVIDYLKRNLNINEKNSY